MIKNPGCLDYKPAVIGSIIQQCSFIHQCTNFLVTIQLFYQAVMKKYRMLIVSERIMRPNGPNRLKLRIKPETIVINHVVE